MSTVQSDTRTRILDAAQDLIQRRGLNAMSFQDLSVAVGIRKPSVHHHFATKAEMVHALLSRYIDNFRKLVQDIVTARVTGKTKLKRYCGLFLQTLQEGRHEKGCLCGMLVAEMLSLDRRETTQLQQFFQLNIDTLRQILDDGEADGSLKSGVSPDVILSTLEGGLLITRCAGGPDRMAKTIQQLIAMYSS